jgi:hypothetical protein
MIEWLSSSVAEPDHVDANPDSAFHFDADPDLTFRFDEYPDPSFQFDTDPDPTNNFSPELYPPMLQNGPEKLPPCNFDADPDPAFHFDADPGPDPASQNDADLDADRNTAVKVA